MRQELAKIRPRSCFLAKPVFSFWPARNRRRALSRGWKNLVSNSFKRAVKARKAILERYVVLECISKDTFEYLDQERVR
jgi:hypothetical protein